MHGASHETGRRAGNKNVIFNVALGKACEIAKESLYNNKMKQLTEYFYNSLNEIFGEKIKLNGEPHKRLPNTLNISFLGYHGAEILSKSGDDIATSTGSACHAGSISISPVLKAMCIPFEIAQGAVRFSLGRYITQEELNTVLKKFKQIHTSKNI
ncbi:aminotransferase class V-fold PLP-dependent enzyme [Petroclostridium sp. X23]|uniref:aminotransferase class V-fold PLP-dependent enzyme n=1 Tax=Petroclostridium sp. X23 TaxID=3045146 RepID=UPI0024AD9D4D|nr:aminotransferase class V-fold PLP-dependent enzyme [Petroclostridium sp. X23]WHH61617.1 aminotransferase class V-fold PLP-dependent enzyme [Petroclostridium sp. X23]